MLIRAQILFLLMTVLTGSSEAANPKHQATELYKMTQCLGQVEQLIHLKKSAAAKRSTAINQWLINFFLNNPGLQIPGQQLKQWCTDPQLTTPVSIAEFLLEEMGGKLFSASSSASTAATETKSTPSYFLELIELWEQYFIYISQGLTPTCFSNLFKEYDEWQQLLSFGQSEPQFFDSAKKLLPTLMKKMSAARGNGSFRKYCRPTNQKKQFNTLNEKTTSP